MVTVQFREGLVEGIYFSNEGLSTFDDMGELVLLKISFLLLCCLLMSK